MKRPQEGKRGWKGSASDATGSACELAHRPPVDGSTASHGRDYAGGVDTLIDVLHIVGAVFIVGPMAILPMTAMRSLRGGNARQVATLAKSTNVFTLLSVIVALLGFGAVGLSDPKYHLSVVTPWILISIILYAIALALNLFLVIPSMRSAAAELETNSAAGGAPDLATEGESVGTGVRTRGYGAIAGGSGIVALLLVAVVVLMVWRP
jgi:uncharacterized membrane protein